MAVVNASFARVHFAGRGVRSAGSSGACGRATTEPWLTIVGVVPDLLMEGIGNGNASPVGYYIPIAQSDVANGVRIAVRTRGDAAALAPQLRSAVAALDPDLALYEVRTLRRIIDQRTWFYTVFGTFFTHVRRLRPHPGGGWVVWRDVVCGDAAHQGDGRAFGAGRARA